MLTVRGVIHVVFISLGGGYGVVTPRAGGLHCSGILIQEPRSNTRGTSRHYRSVPTPVHHQSLWLPRGRSVTQVDAHATTVLWQRILNEATQRAPWTVHLNHVAQISAQ